MGKLTYPLRKKIMELDIGVDPYAVCSWCEVILRREGGSLGRDVFSLADLMNRYFPLRDVSVWTILYRMFSRRLPRKIGGYPRRLIASVAAAMVDSGIKEGPPKEAFWGGSSGGGGLGLPPGIDYSTERATLESETGKEVPMPRYLTVREAAEHFRVRPSTIYSWIRKGVIPAFRVGLRTILIDLDQVQLKPVGKDNG